MSPRDVPLWVRAVAIPLLWLASWWLRSTEALRGVLGDSIALLSLGVVAVFVLRGMQLPVKFWPEGPWREKFSMPALFGTAVIVAGGLLVARLRGAAIFTDQVDLGLAIATVVGAVVWAFALAFVHQRKFIGWYAAAVGFAVLPHVVGFPFSNDLPDAQATVFCLFSAGPTGGIETGLGCSGAAIPAFLYLFTVGAATGLVTEEIAFRRLLVGEPTSAGLLIVLAAGLVACGWHLWIMDSFTPGFLTGALLAFGAISAGSLFVLARSLLVSAVYSASAAASFAALSAARQPNSIAELLVLPPSPVAVAVMALVAAGLGTMVLKSNGWLGGMKRSRLEDAASA